jgi:glycosyltransferase involved in cell wall biosynthesis
MRLVMVSPYPAVGATPVGGVETSAVRLAEALAERSIDITVVAPGPPSPERRGPVTVIRVRADQRWLLARSLRPWRTAVRKVIQDLEADIVHGQSLLVGGLPATDCERSRSAARRIRPVVTAHGNAREDTAAAYSGLGGAVRARSRQRLCEHAAERADVIVGVHPDWRINVPRRPRKFVYIPTIVDELFFQAEWHPDARQVLYCGGPDRIKGWDILMRAWPGVAERVPEARLQALGFPGTHVLGVEDGVASSIDLCGWATAEQTRDAMTRATVLVIPSRFEVAPTVLAEAWAAGVPVIATAAGGTATLAPGAAWLVPPCDHVALAEAIVEVLQGRRGAAQLVAAGSRRAQAHRRERVADAHLRLYSDLGCA